MSSPGTGCFLCPTSACTSAGPLSRGPGGLLGYKRHKGQDMGSVSFRWIDFKGYQNTKYPNKRYTISTGYFNTGTRSEITQSVLDPG